MKNYIAKVADKGFDKVMEELVKQSIDAVTSGLKDSLDTDKETKKVHEEQEIKFEQYKAILSNYEKEIDSYETELNIPGLSEERKSELKSKLSLKRADRNRVQDEYQRALEIAKAENDVKESQNNALNITKVALVGAGSAIAAGTLAIILSKNKSDLDSLDLIEINSEDCDK